MWFVFGTLPVDRCVYSWQIKAKEVVKLQRIFESYWN